MVGVFTFQSTTMAQRVSSRHEDENMKETLHREEYEKSMRQVPGQYIK